jgi:hypothetical protein
MNPFEEISVEIDRFYERNMRPPGFVLVGRREWTRMEQLAGSIYGGSSQFFFVHTNNGKFEVKRHPTYYSMIAPVLERMP